MKIQPLRWLLARSDQAGVFAAATSVGSSFQRTLMPRNNTDQAIVTGASMGLSYLIVSLVQDVVESTASWVLTGPLRGSEEQANEEAQRRATLAMNVAGMLGGFSLQMAFQQQKNEPLRNGGARTAGYWLAVGSFAGLGVALSEGLLTSLDKRRDLGLRNLPVPLVLGSIFAVARPVQRLNKTAGQGFESEITNMPASGAGALALGSGISVALTGMVLASRMLSRGLSRVFNGILPGDERLWRPASHMMTLGMLAGALYVQLQRTNRGIEAGAGKIEGAFSIPPNSPLVSAGPGSLISWETLSREGRRHVSTHLSRERIEQVMGEPAIEPIRIYVGLDSAPTEEERVALAIEELERTRAFDRGLLIAVSPTGTGYVNYVAIESAEYFSRGNCATVTLQYSKRPSPLSLDRVWEGRRHFRMLLAAIRRKLYKMQPEERPRLVVFGESLGAHTSQDAFLDSGTQGLQDAGVERALWIGTPHLSKWKTQVTGVERPDVERDAVAEFDNYEEVEALPAGVRDNLRYVLVTHGNDAVGYFGFDLFIQRPEWLGEPEARPPRVPLSARWIPVVTFVQTLIDMKNAMNVVPGEFEANGHDYRADLARFVREAYALEASDAQLQSVEEALRRYEVEREELLQAQMESQVPPNRNGDPTFIESGFSASESEAT